MNIINNLKKYFKLKTDTEKNVFSTTSADNVLDKNTKFYVDEQINALRRYCDTLGNFVEPEYYKITNTTDLNFETDFNLITVGKLVIGCGVIYTRSAGAGLKNAYVDLPLKLRPKSSRAEFCYEYRDSGTNYNIDIRITKSEPNVIHIMVDLGQTTIPAGKTIPINFVYALDNSNVIDTNI